MTINHSTYLTGLSKKIVALAGIIAATATLGNPVIAQVNPNPAPTTTPETPANTNQTPDSTTEPPANTNQTPGSTTETPTNTNNATSGNLLEVAQSNGSFSTLTQAVEAAGLTNTLNSGSYTILAPTDQAFRNSLPQGAVEFLLRPENRNLLRQVLSYHVVPGEVVADKLRTGSVRTLGGAVAVRVTPQKRVVVNDASVTQTDIKANNGVIHAVNRVLLPRQLRQTIASKLEAQQSGQTSQ